MSVYLSLPSGHFSVTFNYLINEVRLIAVEMIKVLLPGEFHVGFFPSFSSKSICLALNFLSGEMGSFFSFLESAKKRNSFFSHDL